MITLRRSNERGHADHGWLDTYHTFSFAHYHDPAHMGFRHLRVLNDDRVAPAQGFGTHGHRDMEIVTVVLEGALAHRDSMGNGSVLRPGDIQRMSAGKGVTHSEFNASDSESLHLLQIWILPRTHGDVPGYEEKHFEPAGLADRLRLIVSPDGREGSLRIHQDAEIYLGRLEAGSSVTHALRPGRHAWVHIATGHAVVNGEELEAGDAVALSDEAQVTIAASDATQVLVFDLS